jgi:hypothetical protein
MRALAVVLAAFGLLAAGASAQRGWQKGAPMPSRRSEVAVVAGFGFDLASGRWV